MDRMCQGKETRRAIASSRCDGVRPGRRSAALMSALARSVEPMRAMTLPRV